MRFQETGMSMKGLNSQRFLAAMLSFMLLAISVASFASDYVLIANRKVTVSSISRQEAKAIFTGDTTRWDDGKPIQIVILQGGDASRSFLQNVVGKTPSQFDTYWKRLIFTGKAGAPKSFDDPASVVRHVSGTAGAVGFVGAGEATGQVKIISIK